MSDGSKERRRFLTTVTLGLGGAILAVVGYPLLRALVFPVGRRTVVTPDQPIDAVAADALRAGDPPLRVVLEADNVRDGWAKAETTAIGAAWLWRSPDGGLSALSAVCPHLGCAITHDQTSGEFRCPCHRSAFAADGSRKSGPSKRGLDPLVVEEKDGRILVRFVRYRLDVKEREPV